MIPRVQCKGTSCLVIRSLQPCPACQRIVIEKRCSERLIRIRAAEEGVWFKSLELQHAEEECGKEIHRLTQGIIPRPRFEKRLRPEKGCGPTRVTKSPLRREVRPEDVSEGVIDVSGGWDSDWGTGWKTMDEELAEQEAEKPEDVKAYEAMAARELQLWNEDRPSFENGPSFEDEPMFEEEPLPEDGSLFESRPFVEDEPVSKDGSLFASEPLFEDGDAAGAEQECCPTLEVEATSTTVRPSPSAAENCKPDVGPIPETRQPPKAGEKRSKEVRGNVDDTERRIPVSLSPWLSVGS